MLEPPSTTSKNEHLIEVRLDKFEARHGLLDKFLVFSLYMGILFLLIIPLLDLWHLVWIPVFGFFFFGFLYVAHHIYLEDYMMEREYAFIAGTMFFAQCLTLLTRNSLGTSSFDILNGVPQIFMANSLRGRYTASICAFATPLWVTLVDVGTWLLSVDDTFVFPNSSSNQRLMSYWSSSIACLFFFATVQPRVERKTAESASSAEAEREYQRQLSLAQETVARKRFNDMKAALEAALECNSELLTQLENLQMEKVDLQAVAHNFASKELLDNPPTPRVPRQLTKKPRSNLQHFIEQDLAAKQHASRLQVIHSIKPHTVRKVANYLFEITKKAAAQL
jgi:predicted DNA-binding protein YlxM (UPF0122 family)